MTRPVLHQVTVGATTGDAITDQAFLLRRWLREMGFVSEIFAEHIHPALGKEVRPVTAYRPRPGEEWLVYHHSIGSSVVELLLDFPLQLVIIYHNVTPPEYFSSVDPAMAQQMEMGKKQLYALRSHTALALADSHYNEKDLRALGFPNTGVLPIALDRSRYDLPSNTELLAYFEGTGPLLLFVGRMVPNKRQEDLIKLLYFHRRIEPSAGLILVGDRWVPAYEHWLRELVRDLDLEGRVLFTGHVSQQDMVTYYRLADVYVSMSEHEGFGKPLIESMYLGLPVLAYAAAAVPDTLGGAGVLFHHKDYEFLAELVDILVHDEAFRRRIIVRQRERAQDFSRERVLGLLREYLNEALGWQSDPETQ